MMLLEYCLICLKPGELVGLLKLVVIDPIVEFITLNSLATLWHLLTYSKYCISG